MSSIYITLFIIIIIIIIIFIIIIVIIIKGSLIAGMWVDYSFHVALITMYLYVFEF